MFFVAPFLEIVLWRRSLVNTGGMRRRDGRPRDMAAAHKQKGRLRGRPFFDQCAGATAGGAASTWGFNSLREMKV